VKAVEQTIALPLFEGIELEADIAVPVPALGVVVFAHGSASSRRSPRNRYVAEELQGAGIATVLADLLTPTEERVDAVTAEHRFNIPLLSERVIALTDWVQAHELIGGLGIGLFGASTGAAAALVAAAARPDSVGAIVSRGGRPDLAGTALRSVRQPTLLIVGGRDEVVIELNRRALEEIPGEVRLAIVPGATHLFEERGALEQVAALARDWFVKYLGP
jgi:putative phosphoribosyl transferase